MRLNKNFCSRVGANSRGGLLKTFCSRVGANSRGGLFRGGGQFEDLRY